uniref:Uncharacterized protein n=1 Tax=Anguilla anguilla TaxID=7936 RepID=A0A0E9WZH1_ANGAN
MSGSPKFVSPFHRPYCIAAAAPAGKAKLTHPGKAILAGMFFPSSFATAHIDTRVTFTQATSASIMSDHFICSLMCLLL